jgi:hypothetical protein
MAFRRASIREHLRTRTRTDVTSTTMSEQNLRLPFGYAHMMKQGLRKLYGPNLLERVPVNEPKSKSRTILSATTCPSTFPYILSHSKRCEVGFEFARCTIEVGQLPTNNPPTYVAHSMQPMLLRLQPCILVFAFLLGIVGSFAYSQVATEKQIDFAVDVRPILAGHCWNCHGPDEKSRQADLRLDRRDAALASGAFVPNDAHASRIVERILCDDVDQIMPPPSNKKPLTPHQIEILRLWIEQGAKYADHWSFVPPVALPAPKINQSTWPQNPIDPFVLNRLEREGLSPSSEADRATLLRRVSLDLTGLPPTVDELQNYLQDTSHNAYERQVDRLLSSKAFAERLALEWLDLARYADSNGYNNDEPRTMWPWRDWVINALDRNVSYKDFILEQLAGDMLPSPTRDQMIATAFLRNQGHNTEGGIIQEEYRVEYVADRVHTVATVFLGLSMQCARCHDHKFDPISQAEYYQFYAYFNSLDEKQAGYSRFVGAEPYIRVPTPQEELKLKASDEQIAALELKIQDRETYASANLATWLSTQSQSDIQQTYGIERLYRFSMNRSEHDSLFDSVSGSNLGTISGTRKWQQGKDQEALEFDKDTRVELGNIASLEFDKPFSISVWAKPTANETMAVLSKMDESKDYRGYDLLIASGKLEVHLVSKWPDNAILVTTKNTIPINEWHHLAVSYDGSKKGAGIKVYVDGKPEALDTPQDSLKDSIGTEKPFRIGMREVTLPLVGLLDELQLFANVLEETIVKQLAQNEPTTSFAQQVQVPAMQRTDDQQKQLEQFYLSRVDSELKELQKQLADAKKSKTDVEDSTAAVSVMREMNPPRETFVLKRGAYDQPGDRVSAMMPVVLVDKSSPDAPKDRLALARWLVSDSNPLTARVIVNRWWQNLFGAGIVKSAEDFGLTGDAPSHPELLDYLARSFMDTGWDVKAIHKMMVMSATYRQDSHISASMLERDPDNRLLARGARFRMSAETIRDNALAISGLLRQRPGGRSVMPYQPDGLWEDVTVERKGKYVADTGDDLYRRSLYTFWKRTCPPPTMMSFDAPNREVCLARRARTNTPLQSLVLLNDPTYVECAKVLAQHMIRSDNQANERIDAGYQRCVSRTASSNEQSILGELLANASNRFASNPASAAALIAIGATPPDASIDPVELATWTVVASALLNLDETISKR